MENCKVVILSRKRENALSCVASIRSQEQYLALSEIIIVDDGCGPVYGATTIPGAKPFVFARNANQGIRYANSDVILLNDDTELANPFGFRALARSSRLGITSATVRGPWSFQENKSCSFVCVFIPMETQVAVGLLDERFTKYGYEDDDYCRRVTAAGLPISVCHSCIVTHHHPDRSTFHGPDNLYAGDNLVAFDRKYGIKRDYVWPEHLEQIEKDPIK